MRSFMAALAIVSAFAATTTLTPAAAQPAFPPPPYEAPIGPPPGPGPRFIVEPGHYTWIGGRYVWVGQRWIPRHAGYSRFVPGHWGPRGRWIPEHWS